MKRESLRDDGTEPVSVAILRTVLHGRESEFAAGLQEFFAHAARVADGVYAQRSKRPSDAGSRWPPSS